MTATLVQELTHIQSLLIECDSCDNRDVAVELIQQLQFAESNLYPESGSGISDSMDFETWLSLIESLNTALDELCEEWNVLV